MQDKILEAIDEHIYKTQEDGRRAHLGASIVGRECEKEIWLGWRWGLAKDWEPRMLRLFDRGHREEDRFIEWLKPICDEVWDVDPRTGEQIRISDFHGYFGGSLDGVAKNPAGFKGCFLLEFKTHGEKSYEKLCMKKVKEAKPEHYSQMQLYMHYKPKLKAAIYMAINKNNDALYVEVVERDEEHLQEVLAKVERILTQRAVPVNPEWAYPNCWKCKWCDYHPVCHSNKQLDKSCRTCEFVECKDDGWWCNSKSKTLSTDEQKEGCKEWTHIQ